MQLQNVVRVNVVRSWLILENRVCDRGDRHITAAIAGSHFFEWFKLRSPPAEPYFSSWDGVACDFSVTTGDVVARIMPEQIAWATIIFVMKKAHFQRLRSRFSRHFHDKRVICLGVPDNYAYLQPHLI